MQADSRSNHSPLLNKDNSGIDPTWRIYLATNDSPDRTIFDTEPIGSFSYDSGGEFGCHLNKDWIGPTQTWSSICSGQFEVPDVSDGNRTFVASWGLGEPNEYSTCFQLSVTGGTGQADDPKPASSSVTSVPSSTSTLSHTRPSSIPAANPADPNALFLDSSASHFSCSAVGLVLAALLSFM